MLILVKTELVINSEGIPVKRGVYLASDASLLPAEAPVGSRAILTDGSVKLKTPTGWKGKEVGA